MNEESRHRKEDRWDDQRDRPELRKFLIDKCMTGLVDSSVSRITAVTRESPVESAYHVLFRSAWCKQHTHVVERTHEVITGLQHGSIHPHHTEGFVVGHQ